MSTTETVETVESTETVETAPETVERVSTGDPMRDAIIDSIESLTNEANAKAAKIGAATTDKSKLAHEYLTDPDTKDEQIRKFQEWEEALMAKHEAERAKALAYAQSKVEEATIDDGFDVDAAKTEHKALADKVKTARKFYLTTLPGTSEDDLKGVPDLKTLRGGTAGSGTGGKRPRLQSISYRKNTTDNWTEVSKPGKNGKGEEVTVTSFTVLAQTLAKVVGGKVEVKDLQAAAFAEAKTDDLSTLEGRVIEFPFTANNVTVWVKVQPKTDADE